MTGSVLDCSVTAAWVLEDEASPQAGAVLEHVLEVGACAPDLWWTELRNVLIVNERRGRLTEAETTRALTEIGALEVQLDHSADSMSTLRLARKHRLSVYDARYLELALRDGRALATLDVGLARAAAAEGIVLIPDLE